MLYDAHGRPIPLSGPDSTKDHRTKEQKRFDIRFRQAMESGGNSEFPPQLISKIKAQMVVRNLQNEAAKLQQENQRTRLDDLADNVLEDSSKAKLKRHTVN